MADLVVTAAVDAMMAAGNSTGAVRTTIAVGTGDSPQLAGINVGNASDTTITRVSAGVIAVEGKTITTVSGATTTGNLAAFGATSDVIVDSGAAPLSTVTVSAGAGDVGKAVLLDSDGTFDLSTFKTVTAAKGGTGQTGFTTGDILYASGASALSKLGIGSTGQVLTAASGLPSWAAVSGGSGEWLSTSAAIISITGATTATISRWHLCTGTSADYTLTLPAASGNSNAFIGLIMGTTATLTKLVTIDGNASETIDGALTRVMWSYEVAVLRCDGSNWTKVAGKSIPMLCTMAPSTTTSIATATAQKVSLDTAVIDNTGRMADASTNHRINFIRANTYMVGAYVRASNLTVAAAPRWISATEKNGVGTFLTQGEASLVIGSFGGNVVPTPNVYAAADFIELFGYQTSGVTQTIGGTGTTEDTNLSVAEIITW